MHNKAPYFPCSVLCNPCAIHTQLWAVRVQQVESWSFCSKKFLLGLKRYFRDPTKSNRASPELLRLGEMLSFIKPGEIYFPPLASVLETIEDIGCDFKQGKTPTRQQHHHPLPPLLQNKQSACQPRRTSGRGNPSPNSYCLAQLQAMGSRILCEVAGNLNNRLCGNAAVHREICIMCKSLRYLLLQVSYPRFHIHNGKHLIPY